MLVELCGFHCAHFKLYKLIFQKVCMALVPLPNFHRSNSPTTSQSTFAIATWRGDAQRYWLDQVLETARARHEQWLQSAPDQRASLELAYVLGDRKLTPEAVNAVESVLRTEMLDAMPKTIADSCMRHGYCTAELIIWHIMKQLILPPDVSEVTTQKEILTPPKIPPSTQDQV